MKQTPIHLLTFLCMISTDFQLVAQNMDLDQLAKTVFVQMMERNDLEAYQPGFSISSNSDSIATYRNNHLAIERKALEICASFGDRTPHAIAALIGHELAHWKLQHSPAGSFSNEVNKEHEKQADEVGGLLAYLAGYLTFDIMPDLIDTLYAAYHFPDQSPKRISKAERKQLARQAQNQLKLMANAFDLSILLSVLERYDLAANCLNAILTRYPGREIFNMRGVLYLSVVIREHAVRELEFEYPLQIDVENPLRKNETGKGDQDKAREYLQKAISSFKEARGMQRGDYFEAHLNWAIAKLIQNELGIQEDKMDGYSVSVLIEILNSLATVSHNPDWQVSYLMIKGIYHAQQQQYEYALSALEEALSFPSLTSFQQKVLVCNRDKVSRKIAQERRYDPCFNDLAEHAIETSPEENLPDQGKPGATRLLDNMMMREYPDKKEYHVYETIGNPSRNIHFWLFSGESDEETARRIKVGSTREEVLAAYGSGLLLNTRQGTFLHYDYLSIIFFIEENSQKVKYWVTYSYHQ